MKLVLYFINLNRVMFLSKVVSVSLLLVGVTIGISTLFWQQELKYVLPTPVPAYYQPVAQLSKVETSFLPVSVSNKPVFLHFFNPNCPCSRFNLQEFKKLAREHGDQVQFVVVFQTDEAVSAEDLKKKFDLTMPAIIDTDKRVATTCGVYSTPQAVILDQQQQLYYRGNYNKTRYCTSKNTAFAQLSLEALLASQATPYFGELATKAYGCELPKANVMFSQVFE
jgi:hypothetical protein